MQIQHLLYVFIRNYCESAVGFDIGGLSTRVSCFCLDVEAILYRQPVLNGRSNCSWDDPTVVGTSPAAETLGLVFKCSGHYW